MKSSQSYVTKQTSPILAIVGTALLLFGSGHTKADVIQVPSDYPTIQGAVGAANEGDLILVLGGEYTELVTITTPNLTILAVDGASLTGSFNVYADEVAVENWYVTTDLLNQGLQTSEGVQGVSIKNNVFVGGGDGKDYRGVWLNGCRNCSVKNNEFLSHMYDGISVFGNNTGTEIKNNIASDNLIGYIIWEGSVGATLKNNSGSNEYCNIWDATNGSGGHVFINNRDRVDCTIYEE